MTPTRRSGTWRSGTAAGAGEKGGWMAGGPGGTDICDLRFAICDWWSGKAGESPRWVASAGCNPAAPWRRSESGSDTCEGAVAGADVERLNSEERAPSARPSPLGEG